MTQWVESKGRHEFDTHRRQCGVYLGKTLLSSAQWFSCRELNSGGRWFEPHPRHCVVSLSKSLNSLLSIGKKCVTSDINEKSVIENV